MLAIRLGPIQRVSYNLTTWDIAPRRLNIDGRQVRLGGFRAQHPHTIDVIGLDGPRLTLLVLPQGISPPTAHQILITAGHRGNVDNVDDLLGLTVAAEPLGSSDSRAQRVGWH